MDDTTGGETSRVSLSGDWQRTTPGGLTRGSAYVMRYRLDLFSNFTYFLDDPVNGDQFQQSDRRIVSGGRVSHRLASRLGRAAHRSCVVGADLRHDAIGRLALLHTARREPLSVTRADRVSQTSVGGYVQHEVQWTPWMRSSAGLRLDRFQFDVEAGLPENSGTAGKGLASPKASLIFGPWRATELYVNAGYGLPLERRAGHDAHGRSRHRRARRSRHAAGPRPRRGGRRAHGAATGPRDGRRGVAAGPRRGAAVRRRCRQRRRHPRPSRRWGVEWNTYAAPRPWLTVDADLAWSRARFTDADPAGDRIPGAVERVASAGVTIDSGRLAFGSLRLRYFGPRNLVEDGSVRSSSTRLLNGQLGARLSARTELVLDAFNLLDAEASDIDYLYASRLPGEPSEGVEDIHTHPTLPRTLRLSMRVRF